MHRPWLEHYDYWVPPHLTYPERPLWEILDATCVEIPDAPATAFLGATLTFRAIKTQADWLAAAFLRLGLAKGERVGIMLPNCPQYIVTAFAAMRCGAIVVNVNPALAPREVRQIAVDSGMRVLVTLHALVTTAIDLKSASTLEHVIITSLEEYSAAQTPTPRVDGTLAFAELVTGEGRPPVTRVPIHADDVAVLQYTGGTTGSPKGAMLTHRNIFANVVQTETFTYRSRVRGEGRYMIVLPYAHVFGFTVGLMKGTWVGALQILIPKFDVEGVLEAVRDFQPTYFPAVPTVWIALLSHPRITEYGLDRVRIFTSGGAPCPPDVLDRFERTVGRSLFEGFGLSEASPVTHSTPLLGERKIGTIGLPMPDTDLKIVDAEFGTRTCATGEAGELCISGPQIMKGYWNRPEDTAIALRTHDDGRVWLHTGDIATIDADGYTRIVQRKKDMIIVDGFNVYPSEVEAVLCQHADVRLAAAIGQQDGYHGEVVRAYVTLRDGSTTTPDALIAHCAQNLAPYKVPRTIDIRSTLPMTNLGKVLYRVLRDEAASPAEARG
ncbi:MAG: long-chain fatty acid--CoA ligase [Vicinamibacterales bacterium]